MMHDMDSLSGAAESLPMVVSFRQLSISEAGPRRVGGSALEVGRVSWTSSTNFESPFHRILCGRVSPELV